MINPILDSNNAPITLTGLLGLLSTNTLSGLPLGTTGDSAAGELFLKVSVVDGITAITEGVANAVDPTLIEASSNPLSLDLTGNLRTVLKAETTKKIGQTFEGQYSGVPSNFAVGTTDATVFTLAAGEIGFIQNLDDAALAVKKGASASTASFSFLLAAGTVADDGKGGYITIKDWVGVVSVAAMTGSPRYIAWKQTA